MISPNETGYTIEPLSRLSLLLAIQRARDVGFNAFASALVKVYLREYPQDVRNLSRNGGKV